MKITNKKNLSDAIVRSIQRDWYSGTGEKRDFSVTQLLNPAKIVLLTKRHFDDLEEDVSDRIFMLFGSATHAILERATETDAEFVLLNHVRDYIQKLHNQNETKSAKEMETDFINHLFSVGGNNGTQSLSELLMQMRQDRYIVEKRFRYVTKSGKIVTGGIDLYDRETNTLHDYKTTSVYSWIYRNRPGSRKEDWIQQLNMYRLFMESQGFPVDRLIINLIFRDYSNSKAKYDRTYPDKVETMELPLLGLDIVEQMIENKISELEKYNTYSDNAIPHCNSEERWQQQDTWALRKKTNKTATKVEYSYNAIKSAMDSEVQKLAEKDIAKGMDESTAYSRAKDLFVIEKREGLPNRCLQYCPVKNFCNYYQSLSEEVKASG